MMVFVKKPYINSLFSTYIIFMSPLISRNPGFDTRVQKLVDLFNSAEMTSGYGVPSDVITNRAMEIIHRMHSTYVAKDSDYAAD
ncbi:hypothetical protein ACI4A4_27975, partial [Klebsiella pneumoniae]